MADELRRGASQQDRPDLGDGARKCRRKLPLRVERRFGRRPHKGPGLQRGKAVRLHDRAPLRETGQQVPEGPPQLQGGLLQEEMEKDH